MTKLVFRCGEMPIFPLESWTCHRKMNINFALYFTKSHEYHVFVCSRKKQWKWNRQPLTGRRINRLPCFLGETNMAISVWVPGDTQTCNMLNVLGSSVGTYRTSIILVDLDSSVCSGHSSGNIMLLSRSFGQPKLIFCGRTHKNSQTIGHIIPYPWTD
jgi:hypothetical protein